MLGFTRLSKSSLQETVASALHQELDRVEVSCLLLHVTARQDLATNE